MNYSLSVFKKKKRNEKEGKKEKKRKKIEQMDLPTD